MSPHLHELSLGRDIPSLAEDTHQESGAANIFLGSTSGSAFKSNANT